MFKRLKASFIQYKMERSLLRQSRASGLTGDWKESQRLNLLALWVHFIKNEQSIILSSGGARYLHSPLSEVMTEKHVPEILDGNNPLHDKFAEKVLQNYGSVLACPGEYASCMFRPASTLPYPKEYIKKSCRFLSEQLLTETTNFERPANIAEVINQINGAEAALDLFVDFSTSDLPTDPIENFRVGNELAL